MRGVLGDVEERRVHGPLMPRLSDVRPRRALIDACYMWCVHKGLKPLKHTSETQMLVMMAVGDFEGEFKDLNERQRRMIAGAGL